jgi:glycosyltransferase involved in cell wall biosynthesis
MAKALYICYFGLREPLVQTQVLSYLREIRKDNVAISLLTFEPNFKSSWPADEIDAKKKELADFGIEWHALPYHKRPSLPATAFDVINGVRFVRQLLRKNKFEILHTRVHIPAVIAILARKFSRHNPKILFDIRGFVPEEYADAGVWKKDGFLFHLAKKLENWIMKESDGFVVLTEAAREVLFPESLHTGLDRFNRPVEVIPCCVDLKKRFSGDFRAVRTQIRDELKLHKRRVITHVGSLGGLYLTPQIIEFLTVAKKQDPSVFALFLTQSDSADIVKRLNAAGFSEDDYLVKRVDHEEVPAYLYASDIGLSFVQSSYATISRSPTKIPEYLACRLPVIANSGVGDVDNLIETSRLGAILHEFDAAAYEKAFTDVSRMEGVGGRAVATARDGFDLEEVGGKRYRRLYSNLFKRERKTLYVCYFGLGEPLVQTQVLPYLRELAKKRPAEDMTGDKFTASVLTFEPNAVSEQDSVKAQLKKEGIDWYSLPYHKRLSAIATGWDILRGIFFIHRFIARERPDVLHGRVHIATLMGALSRKISRHKPKLLFDIRGFFPEEYTDAGVWPERGLLYHLSKRVERWLLKESDGFVVLTEKARKILFPESTKTGTDQFGRPVEVIPCCVDLDRFSAAGNGARAAARDELGIADRRVIAYVGSFGGWYLTEEMIDFFTVARENDPAVFVMILTQRDKKDITERLRARGFADNDFYVRSVKPVDVPRHLLAADLAVSFIKACYSKQSSSPTKIAEYLACGLPVVANRGVGDVDSVIENNRVGALVEDFSNESYLGALKLIADLGQAGARCRACAENEFDLEKIGGHKYRGLYRKILES